MCFKPLAQTLQSSVVEVDLQCYNMDTAANPFLSSFLSLKTCCFALKMGSRLEKRFL